MAGRLKNVSISNVVAVGAMTASSITGVPGYPVSEILLKNVRVTARGGARAEVAAQRVPELESTYPDAFMFRDLPASGFYVRHARALTLDNVELSVDQPDARPAVVLDDVQGARMRKFSATPPIEGQPLVWLRSVRDYHLSGLRARPGTTAVLRLSGAHTARIRLEGNDFREADQVAMIDASVAATALRIGGNVMSGRGGT